MQRGVDKHQEYPIADPAGLKFQLQIPAMARRHVPDVSRRLFLRRIRNKVVRMKSPTKPGLLRYPVVSEAPNFSAPSQSGVSVQLVSYPFSRVGHEHGP